MAKAHFVWSKEATADLIDLYQNHSILYLASNPNYKNRNMRMQALQDIQQELSKSKFCSKQCLDIADIKSKIHTLRTQFFKELGKVKRAEASGAGTNYLYESKLWCYEQLLFLRYSE